jgi:lipopolysaccharide export system protein LptA
MRRQLYAVIVLTLGAVALLSPVQATAQERAVAFGQSLRLDGSELEIVSDSLEVDQTTGATVFTGNVRADQGGLSIEAQSLRLEYEPGAREGSRRIGRLIASGGVIMATQTEAIEAREAIYSMTSQTLEMTGDVVLVQGASVLAGQRFVADLRAGTGRMIGRVRTVIQLD